MVYDLKSKLSARGKVVEVLGNNTYLVDCGKGPRHISGDVLSKASRVATPGVAPSGGDQMQTAENDVSVLEPEDVEPVSDSSSESEAEYSEIIQAAVPRRRRRVRAEHLGPVLQHRLCQRL